MLVPGRQIEVEWSVMPALRLLLRPYCILDSLFLVTWLKEGYNRLRLVRMGATGLVGGKPREPLESSWAGTLMPKGPLDLAGSL